MCSVGVVLMKLLPATQCLQVLAKCNVDEDLDEETWESWTGGGKAHICHAVCVLLCIVPIVHLCAFVCICDYCVS